MTPLGLWIHTMLDQLPLRLAVSIERNASSFAENYL